MALNYTSLVLKDNALADKTFTGLTTSGSRVVRLDTSTTSAFPRKLTIDHSVVNSKTQGKVNRHLVQVTAVESDGASGKWETVVNLTISYPDLATSLQAKHALAIICDLLQDAGAANAAFDSIVRGES